MDGAHTVDVYKRQQTEPDLKKLEVFVGPPLLQQFMKYAGLDEETAVKAVEYYRERYTDIGIFENEVYPGVEDMLDKLRGKGYILAVASSAYPPQMCIRDSHYCPVPLILCCRYISRRLMQKIIHMLRFSGNFLSFKKNSVLWSNFLFRFFHGLPVNLHQAFLDVFFHFTPCTFTCICQKLIKSYCFTDVYKRQTHICL